MGIYPIERFRRNSDGTLVRTYDDFSGLKVTTIYQPIVTIEERDNCFCCSCSRDGDDAACRNHGYYGKRPCEDHNMPGSPWEDTGEMPESVQAMRKVRDTLYHDV